MFMNKQQNCFKAPNLSTPELILNSDTKTLRVVKSKLMFSQINGEPTVLTDDFNLHDYSIINSADEHAATMTLSLLNSIPSNI